MSNAQIEAGICTPLIAINYGDTLFVCIKLLLVFSSVGLFKISSWNRKFIGFLLKIRPWRRQIILSLAKSASCIKPLSEFPGGTAFLCKY